MHPPPQAYIPSDGTHQKSSIAFTARPAAIPLPRVERLTKIDLAARFDSLATFAICLPKVRHVCARRSHRPKRRTRGGIAAQQADGLECAYHERKLTRGPDPMTVHDEDRAEANRLKQLPPDSEFRQEAERLAKLSARHRKEALAVHWRIANDERYTKSTRDYARYVAETLEALLREILPQK